MKEIIDEYKNYSKKGIVSFVLNFFIEPIPFFLIAILTKYLLEFIKKGEDLKKIIYFLLIFSFSIFILNVIANFSYNIFWPTVVSFRFFKLTEMGKLTMNMRYELLESEEVMKELEIARESSSSNKKGIAAFILNLNKFFKGIISFLLNGAVIFYYMPTLILPTTILFLILLFFSLNSQKVIYKNEKNIEKNYNRKKEFFNNIILDFSAGKEIRVFSLKNLILKKIDKLFKGKKELLKENTKESTRLNLKVNIIWLLYEGILYIYLISRILNKRMEIATVVMIILLFNFFKESIFEIIDIISKILKNIEEIKDYKNFILKYQKDSSENDKKNIDRIVSVEFKNVWFKYPKESNYVLENISFKIEKKEKLAIVGINGSGKTTIIKLLLKFYEPTKGEILINNLHLKDISRKSLYRLIASMFQVTNIYAFTVAENIALMDLIDRKKIIKSLELAGIYKEILKYSERIDKMMLKLVDDNGYVPSGGQAQKIAFARLLYKKADFYIFDEPAASLDPISEEQMVKTISSISEEKLGIYISHRLTTVKFCNKVLLLKNGKQIEYGEFKEILNKKGQFYKMYKTQKELYEKGIETLQEIWERGDGYAF